jgi:hypothetical protein
MTVDRKHLVAIVNMLASESDGERANAAGILAKMAAKEKLLIADFLRINLGTAAVQDPAPPIRQTKPSRPRGMTAEQRELAKLVLEQDWAWLTNWEREFLNSLLQQNYALTERQEEIFADIPERVLNRATRGYA